MSVLGKNSMASTAVYLDVKDRAAPIKLGMRAAATKRLQVKGHHLQFGNFGHGIAKSGAATISTASGELCRLHVDAAALRKAPESMLIELTPVEPDPDGRAREWRLWAQVAGDAPVGGVCLHLPIISDLAIDGARTPSVHKTSVAVAYNVRGPAHLSSNFVSFGLVAHGESREKRTRLSRFDQTVDLSAVTVVIAPPAASGTGWAPAVRARIEPARSGKDSCDIVVLWPAAPETESGSFRGTVTVKMNQRDLPDMEIPYSAVVR